MICKFWPAAGKPFSLKIVPEAIWQQGCQAA
jgi:hypothetical protein